MLSGTTDEADAEEGELVCSTIGKAAEGEEGLWRT